MKQFYIGFFLYCLCVCLSSQAQSPDRNYVLSRTYKQPNSTEATGNTYVGTPAQVNTQISYLDGLGQPVQQVAAFAGPSNQDLMSRMEYDGLLRESKAYLPVAVSNNQGNFISNPNGSWYNSNQVCDGTANYFSQTSYEASPLNRPGETKAPGVTTNGARQAYLVNAAGSIKRYTVNGTGLTAIQDNGTYAGNTLTYTESKDENDKTVHEYRDSYDRIILKRIVLPVSAPENYLDTYYVYDQAGKLRAVLQPMYQSEASLDKYAFLYEYNPRGLLYKKKLPGVGISTMEYDARDRLTSMTDARNNVFYYRYDELNRQIETGVNNNPLVYTYYDDYNFGAKPFFGAFTGANFDNELNLTPANEFVDNPQSESRRGLMTGSTVRMMNADGSFGDWKRSVIYYDNKGRVVQTVRQLYGLSGDAIERVSHRLDFMGRLALERTTQLTGGLPYRIDKLYTYDQADRLKSITHVVYENGQEKKRYVHSQLTYNEIGQLSAKQLHNGSHVLDYKYTARGWMCEQVKSGGIQFNVNLGYDANGNIRSMNSAVNGEFGGTATYDYDGANRLTGYQTTGAGFAGYNEQNIGYDKNGNLTALTRNYAGTPIDQLTYLYNGNQVHRVNDGGNNTLAEKGFIDGANADNEMVYDGNGNLTKDDNRGIGSEGIAYNVLNLTRQVTKDGQPVQYIYDAAGAKRQTIAPGPLTTTYEGAFEYNANGTLARIGLEEGQLVRDAGGNYTVQYYLRDQVGNVRAVLQEDGSLAQVTEYYAFGLPVTRQAGNNKYLYNGKEQQPQTSWSDFGARMYDATLGRWLTVDPLGEVSRRWSPYTYVYNNPVRFVDPDGMLVDSEGRNLGQNTDRADDSSIEWTDGIGKYTGLGPMSRGALDGSFGVSGGDGAQAQGDPPGKGKKGQVSGGFSAVNMPGTGIRKNSSGELESYSTQQNTVPNEDFKDPFLMIIDLSLSTNFSGTNYDPNQKYIGGGAPSFGFGAIASAEFKLASTATRTALADRIGKRGFTEVGYQFQKHVGRGNSTLESFIPHGSTRNPVTWNQAGYEAYKAILRAPGNFQNTGMFLEKRLPDGTGIFLQHNFQFKGFLNPKP